jgi:hypothetical protein
LSWKGSQRTAGSSSSGKRSLYIRNADSRRRLPMKHQGQTTSETISMVSLGSMTAPASNGRCAVARSDAAP